MWKFASENLLSRKIRSLLSLLGMTVAILGMVGLFSVAEGLDAMVSETFGRLTGLVAMQPGAPVPLFSHVPAAWGEEIAAVPGVAVVNSEVWQRVNVVDEKVIISPPRFLFGTEIESRLKLKHGIYRDEMIEGRFLNLADRGTYNAVISRQIADEFEVEVGSTMNVNGQDLTIVGIYHCGSLLLDVAIIVDIDQVRSITRFDTRAVSGFYIEQSGEVENKILVKNIQEVFRGRTLDPWQPSSLLAQQSTKPLGNPLFALLKAVGVQLKPAEKSDETAKPTLEKQQPEKQPKSETDIMHIDKDLPLEIRSAVEWAERFDRFSDNLNIFLTILTAIGVTIAVLSIVNTMLMSVTERIIEIGILKANGWTKRDVMKLITFESAILGFGGGLLGSLLGWIGTLIINWKWTEHVQLYASPQLLIFSVLFSTALGIFGGLYPAIWATRLTPIEAIRRG